MGGAILCPICGNNQAYCKCTRLEKQQFLEIVRLRQERPEVVKPSRSSYTCSSQYAHGWDECDRAYRSAIASAGVALKEVG